MEPAKLSASLLAVKGQAHAVGANRFQAAPVTPLFKSTQSFAQSPVTNATGKRVRKSLIIGNSAHNRLRMLAAKMGMSQQQLMEMAVETMLKQAQDENGCICKLE
ncbi:MAG: hypothetical protein AB3N28_13745 [Kordiimonas sp.]